MPEYSSITEVNFADKIVERTIVSTDGDAVHVRRTQNVEPIIDGVKDARDIRKGGKMRHVGSIPLTVYFQWMQEAGIQPGHPDTQRQMQEVVRRKLQSSDNQKFLVHGY